MLMQGHCANLADVVIGDRVILPSAALADPEFESQNGIGNFLYDTGAVGVVANAIEINAHGPADVCLEDVAQLAIHTLRTNCVYPRTLQTSYSFPPSFPRFLLPASSSRLLAFSSNPLASTVGCSGGL